MTLKARLSHGTVLALLFAAWTAPAICAPAPLEKVDLQLVLAADASRSIDSTKAMLQRQATADALRSPEIIRAIQDGTLGRIGLAYVDWSGGPNNQVIVPWRVIHDKASADAFADALLKAPLTFGLGTAIGEAIDMAAGLIEASNFDSQQKTIDISGDGPNDYGRPAAEIRDEIVARGITINGLPIVTGRYGGGDWGIYSGMLDKYFANCVIGGPSAFVLPAKGFEDFATAIRRKLVLELSETFPAPRSEARIIKVAAVPQGPDLLRPPRPGAGVTPEKARANCETPGYVGPVHGGLGRFQ